MGNDPPENSQKWLDSARLGRMAEQAIANAAGTLLSGGVLLLLGRAAGFFEGVPLAVWVILGVFVIALGFVLWWILARARRPLDPEEAAAYLNAIVESYRPPPRREE